MFVDVAKIRIEAGNGGNGAVSFRREKYVAAGGPDGGDGGKGGDIIFQVDDHLVTLSDFRYKNKYKAPMGRMAAHAGATAGRGGPCHPWPRGTVLREAETGKVMADLSSEEPFVAAKGGRGGWGNPDFATATRQAPRFAKSGTPGEESELSMELKPACRCGADPLPQCGKINVGFRGERGKADYRGL